MFVLSNFQKILLSFQKEHLSVIFLKISYNTLEFGGENTVKIN